MMRQKMFVPLFLFIILMISRKAAGQNAPKSFDIMQPSFRVFFPAHQLATGRAALACPGGAYENFCERILALNHKGI